MSQETMEWLNNNTLIGCTDMRTANGQPSHAWHYMECWQGDEPNHYAGPIPVADLKRRLFNWEPIKCQAAALVPLPEDKLDMVNVFDRNGNPLKDKHGNIVTVSYSNNRVQIVRSDNFLDLGAFKDGYEPHGYNEWLVSVLSNIIGDTLVVSSGGLLQMGAQAWVEASFPETLHDDMTGFDYRPYLLATTSLNGTLATGYFAATNATVCDNTMHMAIGSAGERRYKLKHTKSSVLKLEEARNHLGILHQEQESFAEELHKWASIEIPDNKWVEIMEIIIPSPTDEKESKKAYTRALNKRENLNHVYHNDSMANTWKGTGLGVIQAVNTFAHHYGEIRGKQDGVSENALRTQRNNERRVKGGFADLDVATINAIAKVMDRSELLVTV